MQIKPAQIQKGSTLSGFEPYKHIKKVGQLHPTNHTT